MARVAVSPESRKRFGDMLRRARVEAGLTQQDVCKASGVTEAEISLIENGKRNPSVDSYERLANACGMRIDLVPRPIQFPRKRKPTPT